MHTVFVANRAEIAHRVIRTARRLGYRTAVACSAADRDLPFARAADRAVWWDGPSDVGATYLDPERVVAAALAAGADALHPGYGFLSENAAFAERVQAAGLTWIGPPPAAIRAMGDKATARQVAAAHDVPVVPGHDRSDEPDVLLAEARRIGFPVLIKASAGGGGRGMRRVDAEGDFAAALASARREAQAAFGDGRVLLERYVLQPRHVEVQILADAHGTVLALGERDCSIQRRHQKIVEEAPAPGLPEGLRARMHEAAVRVARAVDYVGAGTVEFVVDGAALARGEADAFFFLEMNTRLQVEHPVTELVTGLDLVELQLRVAEGEPLGLTQADVALTGCAVEVRIYAEDPLRDYLPATGTLHRLHLPDDVRIDAGYASGDAVSPHYDAMLAKLVAHGPDRATATRRLLRAVERAWAPGVSTNLPLLRQVLAHPLWAEAELDTAFLARAALPAAPPLNLDRGVLAALALGHFERAATPRPPGPAGWRSHGRAVQRDRYRCGDQVRVAEVTADGGTLRVALHSDGADRAEHVVRPLRRDGDVLDLVVDGVRVRWRAVRVPSEPTHATLDDGDTVYVHLEDGEAFVQLEPRFPAPLPADAPPGACVAPTPGKVAAVEVAVGDAVEAGQRLVVLEAMKMEHPVVASEAGTVAEIRVEVGQQVDEGALLVRIEPAA
ncbi:MAG: biotin carboxylase N-terminal domain-containing protein [Myxococcota bacterium]